MTANLPGNSSFSAIAKITREADKMSTFRLPASEITIPTVIITAPEVPKKRAAASPSGRCDVARVGSVPMQTTWISM